MENSSGLGSNFCVLVAAQLDMLKHLKGTQSCINVIHERKAGFYNSLELSTFYGTYLVEECEVPFKVDFVSEAKCQESVFDAGVPT